MTLIANASLDILNRSESLLIPTREWRLVNAGDTESILLNSQIIASSFRRRISLKGMVKGASNASKRGKKTRGRAKSGSSSPSTKPSEAKHGKFQGKLSHSSPAKSQRPITEFFSTSPIAKTQGGTEIEIQTEISSSVPSVRTSPRKHPPANVNSISNISIIPMTELNGLSHTPHKIQLCDDVELSPSIALSELALISPRRVTKSRRRLNVCQLSNQQPPTKLKPNDEESDKKKKDILSNISTNHESADFNCRHNLLKELHVASNHKLTEYFPVRRSIRKTKKTVMAEKQKSLEEAVLSQREEGLEVHNFEGKGRGVITTRKFVRGEFVVEYAGELIDMVEAKNREEEYAQDQNTGCYMYYFKHNDLQYCIDATSETGRFGRLVNHSRNGNLTAKIISIGSDPHLVLIAKENIDIGQEVTYDYGDRSKESIKYHPWLAS